MAVKYRKLSIVVIDSKFDQAYSDGLEQIVDENESGITFYNLNNLLKDKTSVGATNIKTNTRPSIFK